MNPQIMCMHCMMGTVVNGRCCRCRAEDMPEQNRSVYALPFKSVLHGQYEIGRVIGCGGFGITYLAWDRKQNRRVAVKELYPCKDVIREKDRCTILVRQGQEDYFEHVSRRFLEEAQLLFQFQKYADILQVYHLFSENRTVYYVMEYLEGADLKSYLMRNGRMDWDIMSDYMKPVLRSLIILHEQDLIHRDISPDNILILDGRRAKLIDFGSVRCYSGSDGLTAFLKHNFAPIEQYRENGKQGPWTDIYSLSVTMYYTLSGVLPPRAPDRCMSEDGTVPVRELSPGIPEYVGEAIMKGMAVHGGDRYQDVRSFIQALYPNEQITVQVRQEYYTSGRQEQPVSRRQERTNGFHAPRGMACIQGYFKGRERPVVKGQTVTIGRNPSCSIHYPPDMRGVSRTQCSLMLDDQERLCIRDDGSTYGTYMEQGRLEPEVWYAIRPGGVFWFANERYQVF